MEGTTAPMTNENVVDEIEEIFKSSMEMFKRKCDQRIQACIISTESMNSVSAQCFLPHVLLGLLNNGFIVHDTSSSVDGERPKILRPFDLLARKYGDEKSIQVKVMAKSNPAGGPQQLLEDIYCMEHSTIQHLDSLVWKGRLLNDPDEEFRHRYNIVIMQNWGLREISDWWTSEKPGAPKQRGSGDERSSPYWGALKLKLLLAKRRGALPVPEAGAGRPVDLLYAMFADQLEEPEGGWA